MKKNIVPFLIVGVVFFSLFFFSLGINTSYGFDVDGFKDGMKKEDVLKKSVQFNFDKIVNENDGISLYDIPNRETYRNYYLSFRNNRLVSVHKNYKPSMGNYMILFKEIIDKYGNSVFCDSTSRLSSYGEEKSIRCSWSSNSEFVQISYNIFPTNDQLSVLYGLNSLNSNK